MMRAFLLLALFGLGSAAAPAAEHLVQQFDGHTSLTTSDFTVPDGWELRWRSARPLSLEVLRLDKTVVSTVSGLETGALLLPQGGAYRVHVMGEERVPWDVEIVIREPDPAPTPTPAPAEAPAVAVAPAPPPIPTRLTPAQEQSIVVVKGDRAQGAGFFLKTSTGPVVLTGLRLLSANPNIQIITRTGAVVKMLGLQGAPDRDLARIPVQDDSYPCLDAATAVATTVQPGDAILTSADGSAGNPPRNATQVTGVSTQRIDLGRFSDHGPKGGPIFLARSGQAIGVVTRAPTASITDDLGKSDLGLREGRVADSASYFGTTFDGVANWEPYDWNRFLNETVFLDAFHRRSRCLDSYLNGRSVDQHDAPKLFLSDDKIKSANDNFNQDTAGGDPSQRTESLRTLLFELNIVADADMDQIRNPANFYTYDRARAAEEIAYRQALKAQLDSYSSNVKRFSGVARRNN